MASDDARFGLMGGTFDPPHAAHLALAEAARAALPLRRHLPLLLLTWHRSSRAPSAATAMATLAATDARIACRQPCQ